MLKFKFILLFLFASFVSFSQTYKRDGKGIKFIQLEGCVRTDNGQPCDSCFVITNGTNAKLSRCLHISELRDIIMTGGEGSQDSVYLITNGDGSYTLVNENGTNYDFGYEFSQGTDTLYLLDHEGNIADYALISGMSGTTIDSFLILNDTLFISLTGDNEAAKKVLLHDYKQTLSFDSGTGDLGISFGNTVNLDSRYGNGIYGKSDTVNNLHYAHVSLDSSFAIGDFDSWPSTNTYNRGIIWQAAGGLTLWGGNQGNGYTNTFTLNENGMDFRHQNGGDNNRVQLANNLVRIFKNEGGYQIDPDTLMNYHSGVMLNQSNQLAFDIAGDRGSDGDVLTSIGGYAVWLPSCCDTFSGGGGGFTLDSVLLKLSGNVMTSKVNTTSDTSLVIGSHSIVLSGSVLTSQVNGVSDTANLASLLTTGTTNVITQNGNQLTSTVNGVSDTTLTVRSNTISYSGSILTSTINGVTDTALITTGGLISDVDLDLSGNILTSDVDGVNDTSLVIGTHLVNLSGNQITSNTNGVTDTTLVIGNVTTNLSGTVLTTSVNGVSDTAQLSSLVSAATTNTLNGTGNIMTSTVNGVADTSLIINQLSLSNPANTITVNVNGETSSASAITSYSNGGTDNTSTISINGVGSASTTIIRSNRLVLGNDSLKTQINGIVSNAVPLDSILLNGVTNTISLSGNTITSNVNTISDTCLAIGNNTLSYDQSSSIMTSSINGIIDTAYMGNFNVIQYVDSIKTRIDANSGIFSTGWSLYQDSQAATYIAWDSLGYMNWKGGNIATYSGLPLGVLPYTTTGMNGAKFQINDSTTSNVNVLHVNNKRTGNLIEDHTINTTHWIDTITQQYRSITAGALSSLQRGLVMDTMGMVGIGVSTPSYELDVTGSTRLNGHLYDINNSSGSNGEVLTRTISGIDWRPNTGATPSIITPSQITSDQDDYNPTGFDDATIVRISGDNGLRAITSMAAQTDGEEKKFINIGSYAIYFPSEHPDGTAANRITYRSDIILMPLNTVTFYYDGTSSRWRPLDYIEETEGDHIESYDLEPGSVTTGELPVAALSTGGTFTATAASATLPSFSYGAATGASSSAVASVILTKTSGTSNAASYYNSYGHLSISSSVLIPTLSDATDSFTVMLAFTPSAPSLFENNSFGIVYSHGMYGGNWTGYTRDGSATNKVDLGVAVSASTVYYLRCEIDKSRTEVRYYINGVYKGRSASNIPAAIAGRVSSGLIKGVGTTSRTLNIFNLRSKFVLP